MNEWFSWETAPLIKVLLKAHKLAEDRVEHLLKRTSLF